MHIEQVLGDVPAEQRCTCREKQKADSKRPAPSIIKRIFGG